MPFLNKTPNDQIRRGAQEERAELERDSEVETTAKEVIEHHININVPPCSFIERLCSTDFKSYICYK